MENGEQSIDDDAVIRFAGFELDMRAFELRRDGVPVPIEPRTFDLIALLARHAGRTVTRDQIFATIWHDRIVSDAALSSQIKAARRALGDDGLSQRLITTIHGRGFRLRIARDDQAGSQPEHAASETAIPPPEAEPPDHKPPRPKRPTLAVLPLDNLDADGRGSVIAQGLTEDLISALSRTRWLRVVSRAPVFAVSREHDDRCLACRDDIGARRFVANQAYLSY